MLTASARVPGTDFELALGDTPPQRLTVGPVQKNQSTSLYAVYATATPVLRLSVITQPNRLCDDAIYTKFICF